MEMINATKMPCPMPVVLARKALSKPGADGVVIKVDNYTAIQNLGKMASGFGFEFTYEKVSEVEYDAMLTKAVNENRTIPTFTKPSAAPPTQPAAAASIDYQPTCGTVIAIGSDTMGKGEEELGRILIKAFIYSLSEQSPPPDAIMFFNKGALLTSQNANSLADLQRLKMLGTKILTCGTCLDYYKLPPPAVGEIANMYEITSIMTAAANVISM